MPKDIIIFGAAEYGKETRLILENLLKYRVTAFTDNDASKWQAEYDGLPVLPPDSAMKRNNTIILATSRTAEIAGQLKDGGFYDYILDVHYIIRDLSREERDSLKPLALSERINLEYRRYGDVLTKTNSRFLLVSHLYIQELKSNFIVKRVEAYREHQELDIDVFQISYVFGKTPERRLINGVNVFEGDGLALASLINQNSYEKLLIHHVSKNMLCYIETSVKKPKLILWVHGIELFKRRLFNYNESEIARLKIGKEKEDEALVRFYRSVYANEKNHVVFVSSWQKTAYEADMGCKAANSSVIHNYIDSRYFSYKPKAPDKRFQILKLKAFYAREYANDITANVIMELSKRPVFSRLHFELYGDGDYFDEDMKCLLKAGFDNVSIERRFLAHDEIREAHVRCGIFLSPSRQDTQGVSMCEAMASGLVVITNRVDAIPEFVAENAGFLCEPENYIEMADKLELLCGDPELFMEMSYNAAISIRGKCSYDNTIKRELELILRQGE